MNNENSSKNISTLVVGSLLIMLALIVFLITSWHSMTNIIKLGIMTLFEVFFLGLSKLLKGKYNLDKLSDTLYYIGITYIPILLILISLFGLLGDYLSFYGDGKYIYLTIASLSSALAYYVVGKKNNKETMIYLSIMFQVLAVICYANIFEYEYIVINVLLLVYNLFLLLLNKNKNIDIIGLTLLAILSFNTFASNAYLSWHYITSWLLVLMNFIVINNKKNNEIYDAVINVSIFKIGYSVIFFHLLNNIEALHCQILMILYTLIIVLLINTFAKKETMIKYNRIISLIFTLVLYYHYMLNDKLPIYFLDILINLMLLYYYKISNKNIYKDLLYFSSLILLRNVCHEFYDDEYLLSAIPAIYTIGLLVINIFNKKEIDKTKYVVLTILSGLSLILLNKYSLLTSIIAIVLSTTTIIFNRKNNKNYYLDLIPLVLLIGCLRNKDIIIYISLLAIPSISTIVYSCFEKETYSYSISSFIFTYMFGSLLSSYLKINSIFYLMMILWSYINICFTKKDSIKNIFKCVLVLFITIMYYDLTNYFMINSYTIIKLLGYTIAGLYIIKEILSKTANTTEKDINLLEYILFFIIYFMALGLYTSAYDGLLFAFGILILALVGYYIKDQAMFTSSLIALLINAIYLTKEFWLVIPWWIYLLIIGGILMVTAIVNEINQNNPDKKLTWKNIVNNIKKHFNK